jgi:hypothetical protein
LLADGGKDGGTLVSHGTGSPRDGLILPLGCTVILAFIHLFEW